MQRKMVVFAPHPDDETLGCGDTIAKKLKERCDVSIVFMTDGGNALLKKCNINFEPTPQKLKEIRKDEARRATKILGVREENARAVCHWLGLLHY